MSKRNSTSLKIKLRAHEIYAEFKYRIIFEGILVGMATGAVVSIFRYILGYADDVRNALISSAKESIGGLIIALLVLAMLLTISFLCLKREPLTSGSGIPQVKAEINGYVNAKWGRVLLLKFIGGICSITAGLSLGREGPSIQLGAMTGKGIAVSFEKIEEDSKKLMICGAGAGLAAAFSAPLAGIVFVIEELHKNYSTEILLSSMASTITADWVCSRLFGLTPVFSLSLGMDLPLSRYWEIAVLGILLGAFGAFYNRAIAFSQDTVGKLNPVLKAIVSGALIVILAIFYPDILGSGHHLVNDASFGIWPIETFAVILVLKFIFSIFSFGTGVPGGIFLPLLVIGGITGGLFGKTMAMLYSTTFEYMAIFVILGMAGYFSAIVKAPLTGVILISEMSGTLSNLLPLGIVAFSAYIVAELLYSIPIYDQLLKRMLKNQGKTQKSS